MECTWTDGICISISTSSSRLDMMWDHCRGWLNAVIRFLSFYRRVGSFVNWNEEQGLSHGTTNTFPLYPWCAQNFQQTPRPRLVLVEFGDNRLYAMRTYARGLGHFRSNASSWKTVRLWYHVINACLPDISLAFKFLDQDVLWARPNWSEISQLSNRSQKRIRCLGMLYNLRFACRDHRVLTIFWSVEDSGVPPNQATFMSWHPACANQGLGRRTPPTPQKKRGLEEVEKVRMLTREGWNRIFMNSHDSCSNFPWIFTVSSCNQHLLVSCCIQISCIAKNEASFLSSKIVHETLWITSLQSWRQ